jgi:hypothetical protein
MNKHLQIYDFINTLAIFIKEERFYIDEIRLSNAKMKYLKQDLS